MENRRGRDIKQCFVNFYFLGVLESLMDQGWWGGAESLIYGQLKLHLFPTGILAEAVSMTHSGML